MSRGCGARSVRCDLGTVADTVGGGNLLAGACMRRRLLLVVVVNNEPGVRHGDLCQRGLC